MKKPNFHDLSQFVFFDPIAKTYKLIDSKKQLPFYVAEFLHDKIDENHNLLLPSIEDLLQKVYPFIENPNQEIINKILIRNQKIRILVKKAIEEKNDVKLVFDPGEEKDRFVIDLAKAFIADLNKFIYKFEITNLYAYQVFINPDANHPFIGMVDVLGKNRNNEWYLFSLKTSKTNYLAKYFGEVYLQTLLFEVNTKFKIKESFILNPRQEKYYEKAIEISKKEKYGLLS